MSDAYLSTIRGSHTMAVRARVCETFETGTDPDGVEVPVFDGEVLFDATADVRGSLTLETDGTRMWPVAAGSALAPYGNELFVERGVLLGGGSVEWVSLGYFRLNTPTQPVAPVGPITIAAQDRMAGLVDGRVMVPRQFKAAATYGDVVTDLVTEVYPAATIVWDAGDTDTLGRSLIAEESRYEFLRDLVTALGKIWFWDYRGFLVIQDPPDVAMPVWDVNAGENGVLVEAGRQLTRERVYNAVVAVGEAADTATPVRAVAYDNNPTSPTYFHGRFGPVPRFFSSQFLTTTAQARSAARSLLAQQTGLPYNVDLRMVPNAALEPYDPITVRYGLQDPPEIHVLETLTVPFAPEAPMTGTTREKTLVLIGDSTS